MYVCTLCSKGNPYRLALILFFQAFDYNKRRSTFYGQSSLLCIIFFKAPEDSLVLNCFHHTQKILICVNIVVNNILC